MNRIHYHCYISCLHFFSFIFFLVCVFFLRNKMWWIWIWTAAKTHLNKLNVIHNRVVRNITYKNRRDSAGPIYELLNILPLSGLLRSEQSKFIYQFTNNLLPPIFDSYMTRPDHSHDTRYSSSQNFNRVRVRTIRTKNTIECTGPIVWS